MTRIMMQFEPVSGGAGQIRTTGSENADTFATQFTYVQNAASEFHTDASGGENAATHGVLNKCLDEIHQGGNHQAARADQTVQAFSNAVEQARRLMSM
ncbi:hypothetical protein [Amycolatopsis samaneae]|uniref:Uncharacterized protein n=1 Tax=Amycolatopsis samaneae TaxID=664691 RepID=A0ABW5GUY7_9PSEU